MSSPATPAASTARRLPLLEDLGDVGDRRVLVRLDLNVPLEDGPGGERVIADDFRIRAALPTLSYLAAAGAEVTVATHLGRPAGPEDARFSVAPIARRLEELGARVRLLENLRFREGETGGPAAGVEALLASLVEGEELYVDDAFGAMHRPHTSIVGPPRLLPAAAGRLVEGEMAALGPLLGEPARPFAVVIGGAKVADKLGLLSVLVERADRVLVGGGMAFTFLRALGHRVGDSIVDEDRLDECRELARRPEVLLPLDTVALARDTGEVRTFGLELPEGWQGLDIGPETCAAFGDALAEAASILWNGPMGVFEDDRFANGTLQVASAIAGSGAASVVGGGDSASALQRFGLSGRVGHVSTGGGATLALIENGDLPGLAALRDSPWWSRQDVREAGSRGGRQG